MSDLLRSSSPFHRIKIFHDYGVAIYRNIKSTDFAVNRSFWRDKWKEKDSNHNFAVTKFGGLDLFKNPYKNLSFLENFYLDDIQFEYCEMHIKGPCKNLIHIIRRRIEIFAWKKSMRKWIILLEIFKKI